MDRHFELAINEKFEKLVRESPLPRLMNDSLSVECGINQNPAQQQIFRPVPTGIVRNRAAMTVSPMAGYQVSQFNKPSSNGDVTNANESIQEIFEYIKQRSFESSREEISGNVSTLSEKDLKENHSVLKDVSVGTNDVSDNNAGEIEMIEYSFNTEHEPNAEDKHESNESSYDEVDMCDTGYGASNIRDNDVTVSESEDSVINIRRLRSDKSGRTETFQNNSHRSKQRQEDRYNEEKYQEDAKSGQRHEAVYPEEEGPEEEDSGQIEAADDELDEIECTEMGEEVDQFVENKQVEEQNIVQEKPACTLYMWIIKPIPGSQCICVEGKKHPDEDEFWKSGVVTTRLEARAILTQSGSVYKLIGDIEFADAVYAGFSRETVLAFRHGFPENWEEVIEAHFNDSLLDRTDMGETAVISNTIDVPTVGPLQQIASKGSEHYILSKWVPKPLGKGVCIIGVNQDGMLWHSSAIEKRISSKRLVTSNGSTCTLKGHMDRLQAKEEHVPDAIVTKFHSGFPKEWQELIQEHFTPEWFQENEKMQKKKKTDKLENDNTTHKATPTTDAKHKQVKTANKSLAVDKKKTSKKQKDYPSKTSVVANMVKHSLNKSSDSVLTDASMASEGSLDQSVLTPAGGVVNLCSLKRSRSGRLLRPPLHEWMGIHYNVTEDGVTIAGTDYAKKLLKEMEEEKKNACTRIARYTYTRLDDTKSSVSSVSSTGSKSCSFKLENTSSKKKTATNLQKKTVTTTSIHKKSDSSINPKQKSDSSSGAKKKTNSTPINPKITNNSASTPMKTSDISLKYDKNSRTNGNTNSDKPDLSAGSAETNETNSKKSRRSNNAQSVDNKGKRILRKNKPSEVTSTPDKTGNQKKRAEKKLEKKIIITKSDPAESGSESGPSRTKSLKLQQGLEDTQLDKEVFVLLKEMKENFKKNKSPDRTTCYSKETRTRYKKDCLKDSYSLDESSDTVNTKDKEESSKTENELSESSVTNEEISETTKDVDVAVSLSISKKSGQRKKESKNLKHTISNRELSSLAPDSTYKIVEVETSMAHTPSRVLRSKVGRRSRADYRPFYIEDDDFSQNSPSTRTKLSTIAKDKEITYISVPEKNESVNNKKPPKTKPTKVKGGAKQMQNHKTPVVETEKDTSEHKGEKEKDTDEERTGRDEECIEKVKESKEKVSSQKKNKKQQSKKDTEKLKEVAITANTGTLKRKIQIKAFLEKQNENYEDNLFDSTPFRNTKKRKRPILDDVDDDELFEELAKKQGKSRFETPAGIEMRSRTGRTVKLASARKTPACYNKEDLLGSTVKNLDGYVHNLKKRQMLRAKRKIKNQTPKPPKRTVHDDSPQKKLFSEFLRAEKDDSENHQDSDNGEDYYWDEETAS